MMKLSRISELCKVNHYFNKKLIRFASDKTEIKNLVHLNQRTLLRLAGDNVSDFLQGLITNDMKHFKEGAVSIYSIFLNNKGRVLYDTIIYKTEEKEVFYVECDSSIADNLLKHFKVYKLRRKVDIQSMNGSMKIWSIFNPNIISKDNCVDIKKNNLDGKIFPCGTNNNMSFKLIDSIFIYSDPRLQELGFRILTKSNVTSSEIIKHFKPNVDEQDICSYRAFRYKLGIAEGVQDLSSGVSFPLEVNCDYLHGVSFHKGCYIGQELTARIHHTGVVRKRLMPLILSKISDKPIEYDEKIMNESGQVVGKFRGHVGAYGLGLIRITEALTSTTLTIRDCILKVLKPHWWPQESQALEVSLKTSKS